MSPGQRREAVTRWRPLRWLGDTAYVVAATPLSAIERAFARRGVLVSRVSSTPEVCDPAGCTGLMVWGRGSGKISYLVPKRGRDFVVVVLGTASGAQQIAKFERTTAGLGAEVHGSAVLVYLKSTARITELRAALASVR
jgi:hypothetical protein